MNNSKFCNGLRSMRLSVLAVVILFVLGFVVVVFLFFKIGFLKSASLFETLDIL